MDRAQFGRLEEIFYEALEIPPADRVFHLRQRCGDDTRLLKTIQELLEAAQQCELAVRRQETSQPSAELPRFGVFQAERVLGRGGAGVVYLARRTDGQFEQLVAVKTIQSDVAAAPIREGFLHERRILAGLRHPNIAQVLDGGIGSDQAPYLVMEYVEGERLDDYCNRSRLTVLARVALMRAVCEAVSFAHRNLIVHLDLKPSNILVDAQGHPKLLDFGTAKILAGADAKVTQALATPRYASPEQIRGERAGVLSDIYSLGVILAELVSGRWPFGDPESRVDTLRRVIEDVAPMALSEAVTPEHADRCGSPLKELRRTLKSDLSAIVSKALETDPERRYRSVDELCADLECFADGLPVLARPQTRRYRAAKFVKRNPWNVAVAGLFVLGMTSAVVFSQHEAELARRQAVRAQHISVFLEDLLGSPNPNWYNTLRKKAKDITITEVLDQLGSRLGTELTNEPDVEIELRRTIGRMYTAVGDHESARTELNAALEKQLAQKDARPVDTARIYNARALENYQTARVREGLNDGKAALALLNRMPRSQDREVKETWMEAYNAIGIAAGRLGLMPEAEKALDEALRLSRELFGNGGSTPVNLGALGVLYHMQGRIEEATRAETEALSIYNSRGGGAAESLEPLRELGSLCLDRGEYVCASDYLGKALDVSRASYGPDSLFTLNILLQRGLLLGLTGHRAEGLREMERVRELYLKLAGANSVYTASADAQIGRLELESGNLAAAESHLRSAYAAYRQILPEDDVRTLRLASPLGECLVRLGERDEGLRLLRVSQESLVRTLGPNNRWAQEARERLQRIDR